MGETAKVFSESMRVCHSPTPPPPPPPPACLGQTEPIHWLSPRIPSLCLLSPGGNLLDFINYNQSSPLTSTRPYLLPHLCRISPSPFLLANLLCPQPPCCCGDTGRCAWWGGGAVGCVPQVDAPVPSPTSCRHFNRKQAGRLRGCCRGSC